MNTITSLDIYPISLRWRAPHEFVDGTATASDHVVVALRTPDGATGWGEACARPSIYGETQDSIVSMLRMWWEANAVPSDPFESRVLEQRLRIFPGNDAAKASLDVAMIDLAGKVSGIPASRLLRGGTRDHVNVTCQIPFGSESEGLKYAGSFAEKYGIAAFKVKVGKDLDRDRALVGSLRREYPEALIYADANQSYTRTQARAFLRYAAEVGLAWLEEPCAQADIETRRLICEVSPIPIAGDESCRTPHEILRQYALGAISQVTVKVARGGLTRATSILDLCNTLGLPVVLGTQGEGDLGTAAALCLALGNPQLGHPSELSVFMAYLEGVLVAPPRIEEGRIQNPAISGVSSDVDTGRLASLASSTALHLTR